MAKPSPTSREELAQRADSLVLQVAAVVREEHTAIIAMALTELLARVVVTGRVPAEFVLNDLKETIAILTAQVAAGGSAGGLLAAPRDQGESS